MSLKDLDRGDKGEIHLRLYDREMAILDELAGRYHCSRAMIVGALLKEYVEKDEPDLSGSVRAGENGTPSRRK